MYIQEKLSKLSLCSLFSLCIDYFAHTPRKDTHNNKLVKFYLLLPSYLNIRQSKTGRIIWSPMGPGRPVRQENNFVTLSRIELKLGMHVHCHNA